VLVVGDACVAHHKDTVAGHGCFDRLDQLRRRLDGEIGADELGSEQRVQRADVHGRTIS
jgi:hypothetical protein